MGTTSSQDKDFIRDVISGSLLEDSIGWIKKNINIDEVFDDDEIMAYCANKKPEEVFSEDALKVWAENNGYKLEE